MIRMLLSWVLSALVLMVLANVLTGIHIDGLVTALQVIAVFGVFNVTLRPLINFLALPLNFLTLGLFSLVINAALFGLGAYLLKGFSVASPLDALLGSLLLSLCTALLLGDSKKKSSVA